MARTETKAKATTSTWSDGTSDAEIERLAKLYDVQQKLIGDTLESAEKITGKKEATAQQAALITLARVMLNLDEAITRE